MGSLAGKVVLVTGASSGIGHATALAFAVEGCRILVCARRLELLEELRTPLLEAGAIDVFTLAVDVRDREAVDMSIAGLPANWSKIDVLVNSAGLSRGLTKVYLDDPQDWEEMIDTNIKGLLYMTRAVVPGMVERAAGHVINLGSTAGHTTYANGAVYCASKAAEIAISEGLKIDLLGTPVRVTSVDPGMVRTDFSKVRFRGDEERAAKVYQDITPLEPADIAETIVWVASRPAHVNVHSIVVTTIDQANATLYYRREK